MKIPIRKIDGLSIILSLFKAVIYLYYIFNSTSLLPMVYPVALTHCHLRALIYQYEVGWPYSKD